MKAKTIQRMSPIVFVNPHPNFDRFSNEEPLRSVLVDLVGKGEISRYRNNDSFLTFNDNETIIEMVWNSRAGAEEYATRLRELDPLFKVVYKIDIEDINDA